MSRLTISTRVIRNLMTSLVISGRITTTKKRASDTKDAFQKLSSRVLKVKGETNRYRLAMSYLFGNAPKKLVDEIESYSHVTSYNLSERKGDGAQEVIVEIVKKEKKVKNG